MRIKLKDLLKARRQKLRSAKPQSRDKARHGVKVAELAIVLRGKGKA